MSTQRDQNSKHPKEYAVVADEVTANTFSNVESTSKPEARFAGTRPWKVQVQGSATTRTERFWLLNKWQGPVLTVGNERFTAQLVDPSAPATVDVAEFSLGELSTDGRALLCPGAMFYWMIGYRDLSSGQRIRESQIWMRRTARLAEPVFNATLEHINGIWSKLDGDHSTTGQRRD